jgi:23S rRNA (cytidine2498-2'-O)-methyltransferase
LKVEEAYIVLGREPQPDETVVDLGAAPGGWSYSAAKRGARVIAIDNGPLKGGALNHPSIEHRLEDAFKFQPAAGVVYDWLFCDLVEEPHHVMQNIVLPWVSQRWCRRFVVNLKFGHVDAIALLAELRAKESPFSTHARNLHIRHLYHDREEFTVVGTLNS